MNGVVDPLVKPEDDNLGNAGQRLKEMGQD